jgi:hypothetical protein
MTRHPQSADAPEAKKRNGTPLTPGHAVDMLTALDTEQAAEEREAVEAVRARFEKKRATIRNRVPVELHGKLSAMLDAVTIADGPPWTEDTLKCQQAEERRESTTAPESIAPASDDVPSRPSLEEYELPAGARDYVPGPAAIAARKR